MTAAESEVPMPMKKVYRRLEFVLRFPKDDLNCWANRYSCGADDRVLEIGERSRKAGYYTRHDFPEVCEWKTRGRPRRHYQRNSEDDVRRLTARALSSADEPTRLWTLVAPNPRTVARWGLPSIIP